MDLWDKDTRLVRGESCMFVRKRSARLLFPVEAVERVYNSTTGAEYVAGRDFEHKPMSNEIYLTPNSAIPFFDEAALYPPPGSILYPETGCTAIGGGPDGRLLRFDNKSFFAESQVEVDYVAGKFDFPFEPDRQPGRLPRLRKLLAGDKKVVVTAVGDSITDGYNASKRVDVQPYQPPYIELFAQLLRERFQVEVTLHNRAVSGSGCRNAFELTEKWLGDVPDLLVIAYGMNDLSMNPADFADTVARIIQIMRERNPQTEFLLVASMSGNPEWTPTRPGPDREFAAALRQLAERENPGTAFADVHRAWTEIVSRKGFHSLTGNGVNHPNDYGHRVYAAVLKELIR